jgi:hypothetical protein
LRRFRLRMNERPRPPPLEGDSSVWEGEEAKGRRSRGQA